MAAPLLALAVAVAAIGCSSGDQGVSTGDDVIHLTRPDQGDGVVTAVFWVRPHGDPRAIDLPTFSDAEDGPHPLVVYGSITNGSDSPLVPPQVEVRWIGPDDVVVHTQAARVVDPHGAVVAELAPGGSADVVAVVGDAELGRSLGELLPVIEEVG